MDSSRRDFIKKATTGAAFLAAPAILGSARPADAVTPLKLKYAPGLSMFSRHAGQDPVDNIKFCHDQGFRAVFDNGLMRREPAVQEKIMNELTRLDMDFGPFVLRADPGKQNFVLNTQEVRDMLVTQMKEGVEVSKRTGAKQALVVCQTIRTPFL